MEPNDSDEEWKVRVIMGNEIFNGVVHYWVDWELILTPEYVLGNVWHLVEAFWDKKQTQHKAVS